MKTYTIQIRRNSDGKVVEIPWEDDNEDSMIFQWEDNNYACDCNRSLFFDRACGLDPDVMAATCGDKAYSIRILDGAREVYEDFSD